VSDKFGPAGLTGVAIIRYAGDAATIESLFMSCRVLGRGVEFAVWETIFADAGARGCRHVRATYKPTAKNTQAADFYDRLGLPLVGETDAARGYETPLAAFVPPPTPWITVLHD
jgi:predicted enzyme involved in methoxymalonyl-ACP biosynthesis